LTNDDVQSFDGNVDRLMGLIQRKTGEAESVERFLNEVTTNGRRPLCMPRKLFANARPPAGTKIQMATGGRVGTRRMRGIESWLRRGGRDGHSALQNPPRSASPGSSPGWSAADSSEVTSRQCPTFRGDHHGRGQDRFGKLAARKQFVLAGMINENLLTSVTVLFAGRGVGCLGTDCGVAAALFHEDTPRKTCRRDPKVLKSTLPKGISRHVS
jgi:hypothetical protein